MLLSERLRSYRCEFLPECRQIHRTSAAERRLKRLGRDCAGAGYSMAGFSRKLGRNESYIAHLARLDVFPKLGMYVYLGEFFGWDMSTDANYLFWLGARDRTKRVPLREMMFQAHMNKNMLSLLTGIPTLKLENCLDCGLTVLPSDYALVLDAVMEAACRHGIKGAFITEE